MPTPIAPPIILSQNARSELQTLARAHSTPQSLALRARMVLRAAAVEQPTNLQIGHELGCSNLTVGKWRRRYLELGFPGLQEARRSGRPRTIATPTRVQVISVASALPQDQERTVTRWTLDEIVVPYLTLSTPMPSAAQASGVSCKTSISSLTRVSTGSIATMRTLMQRPTTFATCTPRRLRLINKVAW
jgi:transposase